MFIGMAMTCAACSVKPKSKWSSNPLEDLEKGTEKPVDKTVLGLEKLTDLLEAVAGDSVGTKVGTESSKNWPLVRTQDVDDLKGQGDRD